MLSIMHVGLSEFFRKRNLTFNIVLLVSVGTKMQSFLCTGCVFGAGWIDLHVRSEMACPKLCM